MATKKRDYWGRIVTITPQGRQLRVSNFALEDEIKYQGRRGIIVGNGCSCVHIILKADKDKLDQWRNTGKVNQRGLSMMAHINNLYTCVAPSEVKLII